MSIAQTEPTLAAVPSLAPAAPEAAPEPDVQMIFQLSITRSGSTLVQRILGSYDDVATASEPWVLLPQVYALRDRGVRSEYHHEMMAGAVRDFCDTLPGGRADYEAELRRFMLRLYEKAAGGRRYFLEKSPPYFLIVHELFELFPDAKFVFLWRNPLSILASISETWCDGRWQPHFWRHDLFKGLPRLVEARSRHADRSVAVNYENLVVGDEASWRRTMDYLGFPFDPASLERFSEVKLGRMGDPTGIHRYHELSEEPMQKWRSTINNPVRKEWCRRYLRWLGRERVAIMGYELDALLAQLDQVPNDNRRVADDLRQLGASIVKEPLRDRVLKRSEGTSAWRYLLR